MQTGLFLAAAGKAVGLVCAFYNKYKDIAERQQTKKQVSLLLAKMMKICVGVTFIYAVMLTLSLYYRCIMI